MPQNTPKREPNSLIVGVLALQGGVQEHERMLSGLGVQTRLIRSKRHFEGLDALVLPGGESSTIDRLLRRLDMFDDLRELVRRGIPVLATCAGLILLANRIKDAAPAQQSLEALDVEVQRNAFGNQCVSCEEEVHSTLGSGNVAFIRAPKVLDVGEGVEIIAKRNHDKSIVGVATKAIIALAFHPELTEATVWHEALIERACAQAKPYTLR